MLKKNLDLYKEKFNNVSKDQKERIKTFLSEVKFTEKDLKKFNEKFNHILDLEYESIKMIFYIIPETTPRPRLNFMHGNFYVKNASSNSNFMKLLVEKEDDLKGFITTPCHFTCKLYFPIPSNMTKVDTLLAEMGMIQPPINKDFDNLAKTYSDMIQKWLLLNDSLIVKGTSEKYWSLKPRVEIQIDYLIDYDCTYNKRLVEGTKAYKGISK